MRHEWRYIITEVDTGAELGELWRAGERRFTRPLVGGAGAATLSSRIELDHPMVSRFMGAVPADRLELLVKVYRDDELLGVLDVLTGEAQGEAGAAEAFPFSAAGPVLTRLNTRLLGRTPAGYTNGSPTALKDLSTLLHDAWDAVDAPTGLWGASGYNTGIGAGIITPSGITSYVDKVYFKPAAELMAELSQAAGGPDFQVEPIEPQLLGGATRIGLLQVAPVIGVTQPKAILEYQTGRRNLSNFRQPLDAAGMVNVAYHLAPGFPDTVATGVAPVIVGVNNETRSTRMREAVVAGDFEVDALRQRLVDETVRVRGYPRETIFVTLAPNADVGYGTHFVEGDFVEARGKSRRGRDLFDALFRIYGVEFVVDDLGTESIELALINEASQTL